MDQALGYRIIDLRNRIVASFDAGNWEEVGLLTGHSDQIVRHPRLLRSLDWGDEDYAGNVLTVLRQIVTADPHTLPIIESYLNQKFPGDSQFISAKPSERKITFAPNVFQIPDGHVELDLVSVMMPFAREFDGVHEAIQRACKATALRSKRVDNIWEHSTLVQDIFSLIFRSQVVIVDFTGKNPNVMYETGIAHTLGKHVVPIAQSLDHVPFDLGHHRVLTYHPNAEGLHKLEADLANKLKQFAVTPAVTPAAPAEAPVDPDEIPF